MIKQRADYQYVDIIWNIHLLRLFKNFFFTFAHVPFPLLPLCN